MGIFKKKKVKDVTQQNRLQEFMMTLSNASYIDIVSAAIGVSRLNQVGFENTVLNNLEWNVDMIRGQIRFGDRHYAIQFVGSESKQLHSWKWSWDNVNEFPEALFASVEKMRDQFSHTREFVTSNLPLSDIVNGEMLAAVCAAVSDEKLLVYPCYYDGGVAYVVVRNMEAEVFVRATSHQIISTVMQVISEVPLNAFIMVKGIFITHGIDYSENDKVLVIKTTDKEEIEASFDERNRLISIKTL